MKKALLLLAMFFFGFIAEVQSESVPSAERPNLNVSPQTLAHVLWPQGKAFCIDLTAINNAFPTLVRESPRYWADCDLKLLSPHYRAGYPQSDDHAAFCQSLYLLRDGYPDRFEGLDMRQWPFTPCLDLLVKQPAGG
jgi:hypothetical protein